MTTYKRSSIVCASRRLRLLAVVVGVSLVAAACGSSSSSTVSSSTSTITESTVTSNSSIPRVVGFDGTAAQIELDALFDAEDPSGGGVVLLAVVDGVTTKLASGVANDAGDPLTADYQFRVGSISKTFVAVMVMQMVDEGLLDLSDPLSKHLPDTTVGADVTIEQLLAHRSGVPRYLQYISLDEIFSGPLDQVFTPNEIVGAVVDVPSEQPGGPHSYSNTNYILLGQVIEELDGRSINDALQARIAEPLGLKDTLFAGPDVAAPTNLAGPWVDGLMAGDPTETFTSIETLAWAAGSLVSTADDLAIFVTALRQGDLVTPSAFSTMVDFDANPTYGLGLGDISEEGWTTSGWGHGGSIPGYHSYMAYLEDSDSTYVVITNNDDIDPVGFAVAIHNGIVESDLED